MGIAEIWEYVHGMQGMWECIEIINLPGEWYMGIAEIWEYMGICSWNVGNVGMY